MTGDDVEPHVSPSLAVVLGPDPAEWFFASAIAWHLQQWQRPPQGLRREGALVKTRTVTTALIEEAL